MAEYPFVTLDVFTDRRFGGNPLAVFYEADGLSDTDMQALSAEMNLSETTFVLPPHDGRNTARVRIFNRSYEMPFAGHPNVGTAYALAMLGLAQGPALRFEEPAGLVEVRLTGNGADIDAPQPLALAGELPEADIAACIGLDPSQVIVTRHRPLRATTGVEFILVEVEPDALRQAAPDVAACRRLAANHPELEGRVSIFLYAAEGPGIRARMFAPLAGTWEDPATGSANATLAALRLSLSGQDMLSYEAVQGEEIGRPSRLRLTVRRTPDGIRASVGGARVPVFRGSISI